MEYKYSQDDNFEDFACGRVIYHKTGMPSFPVRLANEIYRRCLSYLESKENITLYDPCCGGGYLLTVLGVQNNHSIGKLYGSDIDPTAVSLAADNLSLLTKAGLEKRKQELQQMYTQFGKQSHLDALDSLPVFANLLAKELPSEVFLLDILSDQLADRNFTADIICVDVPYGNMVSWSADDTDAINIMIQNLSHFMNEDTVLAVISDKKQKLNYDQFRRLEKNNIGKRKFELLQLL
ncbi:MAG: hypothetical protein K0S47_4535 [Herbinix sp.]|jgi:23S rRNA G2445 N2-methylase RlmL|nr:hypothetical protein [Herbinix sp.]